MLAQWLIAANLFYSLHPLAGVPAGEAHDLHIIKKDAVVTGRIYYEGKLGDGEYGAYLVPDAAYNKEPYMDRFNAAFSELWVEMPKPLRFRDGQHVRVYGTLDREYNDGWWWKELNPVWCLQGIK